MTNTCGRENRQGEPCSQPAGWGTNHPGEGPCKFHGGSSPQVEDYYERKLREQARHELPDGQTACPFDPDDSLFSSHNPSKVIQHATTWCEHAPDGVTRGEVEAILDPDDPTTVEDVLVTYEDRDHMQAPPSEANVVDPVEVPDEEAELEQADDVDEDLSDDEQPPRAHLPPLPEDLEERVHSHQADVVRTMLAHADRGEPVETSTLLPTLETLWGLDTDTARDRMHDALTKVRKKDLLLDEGWGKWSLAPASSSRSTPTPDEDGDGGDEDEEGTAHVVDGFLEDLGATVRDCLGCGSLVAGGPVRCVRCADEVDVPHPDGIVLVLDEEEAKHAEMALREMAAGMNKTPSSQRTVLKLWHRLDEKRQEASP